MENTNPLTQQEEAEAIAILKIILAKLDKISAEQLVQRRQIERLGEKG